MTQMPQRTPDSSACTAPSAIYVGLDLGVRRTHLCAIDATGKKLKHGSVASTEDGLMRWVEEFPGAHAVLETGATSRWVEAFLRRHGWRAITTDAAHVAPELRGRGEKSDARDAAHLAELLRTGSAQLCPVHHKPEQFYFDYTTVVARAAAVAVRTKLLNQLHGIAKTLGKKLSKSSVSTVLGELPTVLPQELGAATDGLRRILECVDAEIRTYDAALEEIAQRHVITARLREIPGVGRVTAVTFALVVFQVTRFPSGDALAAYLGLTPRRYQSGERDPECRITKQGNPRLRSTLIQAANYLLTHGPDCDLKRWALRYCERAGGGKTVRKRAVVALARKLVVVMYALWKKGGHFEPLRTTHAEAAAQEERLRRAG